MSFEKVLFDDIKEVAVEAFGQLVWAAKLVPNDCENWSDSDQQERAVSVLNILTSLFGNVTVEDAIRASYQEAYPDPAEAEVTAAEPWKEDYVDGTSD